MPESARWLIANGKLEQAQMYLKKCAKMNQTEDFIHTLKTEVSIFLMMVKSRELTTTTPDYNYFVLSTTVTLICIT